MNADDAAWLDEQLPLLLTAYDEALAAGTPVETLDLGAVPEEQRPEIKREIAWYRRVRGLWRKAGSATSDLATSAPASETPLSCLGRFQIRQELGRGAFGVVFLAYDPLLAREVALKVPRAEVLLSTELRARFQQEARAAAGLHHPNLVPVYDAGEEGSVCWIASAYCPGITLAAWLKQRSEAVPYTTAAGLVKALAEGMEHAHQHGVLHRDLKPANILLASAEPRSESGANETDHGLPSVDYGLFPKIADFGLAKLMEGAAGAPRVGYETQSGAIVGTAGYMAPEQASGHAKGVGPAADIYALGVILYELLTRRTPFQGDTPLDTLMLVRTQEPLSPAKLRPHLPRDLETVCLKCLDKEPARRYPSAGAMAEDLRRYLAGEPIQARPTPAWERSVKWARRRPALAALVVVSGVAVITVLLVVFITNHRLQQRFQEVLEQRRLALANFRKARAAVDELLTRAGSRDLSYVPYMENVRRDLLRAAVRHYQEFVQQSENDPEVRQEAARSYERLADLYGQLGETDNEEKAHLEAIDICRKLSAEIPEQPAYRGELAKYQRNLGHMLINTSPQRAETLLLQALESQRRMVADYPNEPGHRAALGSTQNSFGMLLLSSDRLPQAEHAFHQAVETLEQAVLQAQGDVDYEERLAVSRSNLAVALATMRQFAEAEGYFRQDRDYWAKRVAQEPTSPNNRSKLARSEYHRACVLLDLGRPHEAEPVFREAIRLRKDEAEDFPKLHYIHYALSEGQQMLAKLLLANQGDPTEARLLLEQAVVQMKTAVQLSPESKRYLGILRDRYGDLADALIHLHQSASASKVAAELIALFSPDAAGRLDAVRFLARRAAAAEKLSQLSHSERQQLNRTWADWAIAQLREAVQSGYRDAEALTKDPALSSLSAYADFQAVLRDLATKAKSEAR